MPVYLLTYQLTVVKVEKNSPYQTMFNKGNLQLKKMQQTFVKFFYTFL